MAKAIQTVCVCVCVCTCLSVFCVFVWLYLWSVGGEKLYRQRRSGGSAPIGFRPIAASLVIGNSANHVRRDRSHMCKDNAMTIQRQCKGCISSFNCLIPSRVNWIVWFHQEWIGRSNVFSHRRRHWPRIFQLVECMWKTADITKTPNTSPHQCLTRLTSFSSWIAKSGPPILQYLQGTKAVS